MTDYALPLVVALLLWWAGTGAVLLLDRLPRHMGAFAFFVASLATVAALACIGHSAHDAGVSGAYAGFSCAILVWGWHEFTFLSGWITGPRRDGVTPGAAPLRRLSEAVQVLLWHEIALLVTAATLWIWLGRSQNPVAAWTFTLLYVMRVSAKVNLYLGVRNLSLEFLPAHLSYLGSYFRTRRFNGLMPWSLLAGVVCSVWLVEAASAAGPGRRAALMLLVSMLGLALIEHLMMVLPMQPAALWRWALKRRVVALR
ncbi:MAG: putative photosynthetic complex assembly protein PuhE [Rubrivivax sp.]